MTTGVQSRLQNGGAGARVTTVVTIFMVTCLSGRAWGLEPRAAELIRQAGNADDDSVRLDYLEQLQAMPDLDETLRADAGKLVKQIDRWMHDKSLNYFGREVSKKRDFDFGIAADSPLYPLTYLYRGRMVAWYAMEMGGIWNVPERRREWFDAARGFFEQAAGAFPENRIARMYLGEPIEPRTAYAAVVGAPAWAVYQREGLERLADIITWWIDHRMRENGEYGGEWGDDCEMWRWWVPVLIGFEDAKIDAAQARFSEALMSQPHMEKGYTRHMSDVEHTAEDSADVITPMMHIDPDNPAWSRRALRLAELMETLWTGRNERGLLQFKSTNFTGDRVDEDPQRTCDTVYHPRAVQPALLYWQRTADDRLTRLFSAWMDMWVDATARAERGKPAGIIPSAIHWPDGRVGGLGPEWWDPQNYGEATLYRWPSAMGLVTHALLLTHHMTGDAKYLRPIRSMAAIRLKHLNGPREADPKPGSEAWCAARMGGLGDVLAKYRLLTGSNEFDALLQADTSPYTTLRLHGDRGPITSALQENAEALRVNFAGYTSEVRYTDRVLRFPAIFGDNGIYPQARPSIRRPDSALLYSAATGDAGDAGYFPLNAVRWLTPPRDIAALVTASGTDRLAAELFHFGERSRPMSAELYLLAPGAYTFTLTLASDTQTAAPALASKAVTVTGPRTRLSFELPPRKLCILSVSSIR